MATIMASENSYLIYLDRDDFISFYKKSSF